MKERGCLTQDLAPYWLQGEQRGAEAPVAEAPGSRKKETDTKM